MTYEKVAMKAFILVEPSRKSQGTLRLNISKPFDITLRAINLMAFDWLQINHPEYNLDDLTRVTSSYDGEELKLLIDFSIFRTEEN